MVHLLEADLDRKKASVDELEGKLQGMANFGLRYFLKYSYSVLLIDNNRCTVGIKLSDLNRPWTSKLGWRYFEANTIDRNELQIRKNSQKGTGTKMAQKLNSFEKFERKKIKYQPCSQPRDFLRTREMPQNT